MLYAIDAFSAVKGDEDKNMRYYYFFFYQVIKDVFRPKNRNDILTIEKRNRILENIHLQTPLTQKKNQEYWRKICDYLKDKNIFIYTQSEI